MANNTVNRLGQINATGDTDALFLKVFSGTVLNAFHNSTEFRPRHTVRTIASGKSAQFPVTGRARAAYHTPGVELTGGSIKQAERLITIEDVLIADVAIANIDEMKNHYDLRSIYAEELGDILAQTYDQSVARTMVRAARTGAVVDGLPGGSFSNNAAFDNDGVVLYNGVFNAGVALDQRFIPKADRTGFFRPVQYALIVQSEKPIDFDLNQGSLPNGSIASGTVKFINGIGLVKTNNLPGSDDRTNTDIPALRRQDFSTTRGLIAHKSAAGTLQMQDVTMETEYSARRQSTLMLAKYLVGHDVLRPESAHELRTADPS